MSCPYAIIDPPFGWVYDYEINTLTFQLPGDYTLQTTSNYQNVEFLVVGGGGSTLSYYSGGGGGGFVDFGVLPNIPSPSLINIFVGSGGINGGSGISSQLSVNGFSSVANGGFGSENAFGASGGTVDGIPTQPGQNGNRENKNGQPGVGAGGGGFGLIDFESGGNGGNGGPMGGGGGNGGMSSFLGGNGGNGSDGTFYKGTFYGSGGGGAAGRAFLQNGTNGLGGPGAGNGSLELFGSERTPQSNLGAGAGGFGNRGDGAVDGGSGVIILTFPTPSPTPTPTPTSNICFPAGTPILTNQGNIPIEQLNPEIHTIRNKKIVGITKTITQDKFLVCFAKDSLAPNIPSQQTIISQNHCLFYQGKMTQAKKFIDSFEHVTKMKYTGEILYNVLMEEHEKMVVNNLICETLHPENGTAKLYRALQKLTPSEQVELIKKTNEYAIENKVFTSKKCRK